MPVQRVFLIRHGETEWSLNGRHTGVTDLPLTERGRTLARRLAPELAKETFATVWTSPLQRARETCELAGFANRAEISHDLMEWDYGAYEGLTTKEIHQAAPGWVLFRDGCPGGETPEQVRIRIDRAIARVRTGNGDALMFAHGHIFRTFAARWIGLPVSMGSNFLLDTATLNILGYYGKIPALQTWNARLV